VEKELDVMKLKKVED
jgi:hypothetical protein